jgi:hypothetical protein
VITIVRSLSRVDGSIGRDSGGRGAGGVFVVVLGGVVGRVVADSDVLVVGVDPGINLVQRLRLMGYVFDERKGEEVQSMI